MKKLYVIVAFAAALAVGGCSSGSPASSTPEEAVSATPTPTPTAMSSEEAGKFYLAAVCPRNVQGDKMLAVFQTEPFDVEVAKAEASALRDTYRSTIETLSDVKVVWPDAVKSDVVALTEGMYEDLGVAQHLANQTTDTGFFAVWNGWETPPEHAALAQKIRLKLGLPADTSTSCVQ